MSAYATVLDQRTHSQSTQEAKDYDAETDRQAKEQALTAAGAAPSSSGDAPTAGDAMTVAGQEWIQALTEEVEAADQVRRLVRSLDPRERSGTFSTTFRALRAYQQAGARRATRLERFDAAEFVRFGLDGDGAMPTFYIIASDTDQAETAGVVCGLIQELRQAAHELARETNYRRDRPLFAPPPG